MAMRLVPHRVARIRVWVRIWWVISMVRKAKPDETPGGQPESGGHRGAITFQLFQSFRGRSNVDRTFLSETVLALPSTL